MSLKLNLLFLFCIALLLSCGGGSEQENNSAKDGLNTVFYEDYNGRKGEKGDIIEFDIAQRANGQEIANTFQVPLYRVRAKLKEPDFEADYMHGLLTLGEGDSVIYEQRLSQIPASERGQNLPDSGILTSTIKVWRIWNEEETIEQMIDRLSGGQPEKWTTTAKGVKLFWDEKGKGPKAEFGDVLTMHIKGLFISGEPFMSTRKAEKPVKFIFGEGQIEPRAWEEVAAYMQEGDKVTVISPYDMAYGSVDRKPILKYSTIVFEIDLIKVEKASL